MVKPLSKVKFNLVRVLSNSAAGRKFFRYRVNVALYRPFLERLGLGVGLGLCSSLRLINAICGSYMVGLAFTAWHSSSLKQSTAMHVPPIMKARSHVLRSQQRAMHMCMFFSSPRSLKFPAFIPPLSVTFFSIGLWVQWSSSWVKGSSTDTNNKWHVKNV